MASLKDILAKRAAYQVPMETGIVLSVSPVSKSRSVYSVRTKYGTVLDGLVGEAGIPNGSSVVIGMKDTGVSQRYTPVILSKGKVSGADVKPKKQVTKSTTFVQKFSTPRWHKVTSGPFKAFARMSWDSENSRLLVWGGYPSGNYIWPVDAQNSIGDYATHPPVYLSTYTGGVMPQGYIFDAYTGTYSGTYVQGFNGENYIFDYEIWGGPESATRWFIFQITQVIEANTYTWFDVVRSPAYFDYEYQAVAYALSCASLQGLEWHQYPAGDGYLQNIDKYIGGGYTPVGGDYINNAQQWYQTGYDGPFLFYTVAAETLAYGWNINLVWEWYTGEIQASFRIYVPSLGYWVLNPFKLTEKESTQLWQWTKVGGWELLNNNYPATGGSQSAGAQLDSPVYGRYGVVSINVDDNLKFSFGGGPFTPDPYLGQFTGYGADGEFWVYST